MILVAGTKRSGTSMWMQILQAAGLPLIGDAFPSNWEERLRPANPRGFWESSLREGIYFRSNPNPETGHFLRPAVSRWHAVKVFPFGLVRTDLAYIEAVVGTMRDWRSYDRSLRALRELESTEHKNPLPPWAEWWVENYELVRDLIVRGHRSVMQSYDHVVKEPEESIRRVLEMLGRGDLSKAVKAVAVNSVLPPPGDADAPAEFIHVFDELFDRVDRSQPLTAAFIREMNSTHLAVVETLGITATVAEP